MIAVEQIEEMVVLVEPDCIACVRVLETVMVLRQRGLVANVVVLDRLRDPERCRTYGVVIYPAVFINWRLAFYGEFSTEDALRFVKRTRK